VVLSGVSVAAVQCEAALSISWFQILPEFRQERAFKPAPAFAEF
jgi:hypothetical protein